MGYEHLQFQRRASTAGELHCLLLDCSGSMLKRHNLALAKGLLAQLSAQLYRRRSELAVIAFAGRQARVLQAPRKAAACNLEWIAPIGGGGGSPLLRGLEEAERLLSAARRRNPGQRRYLWLFSDGRFQQLGGRPQHADHCLVVDFDNAPVALGRAERIAGLWQGEYWRAEQLLAATR
ncbi:vWA domain-containing protein [Pseudomonas sp. BMS12]|uniref:vWA domain-containing protein n=1 Tax=Pseudomonas sp. BMS12 TaxID=1796033 RepID=UPI000A5945F1|nr:VWA domain-containing protein [Pseudomonas sp. BMS12]